MQFTVEITLGTTQREGTKHSDNCLWCTCRWSHTHIHKCNAHCMSSDYIYQLKPLYIEGLIIAWYMTCDGGGCHNECNW